MRLMDRLFAPARECISFPDLLIGLSGINNEPLSDVIYYLSCCDFELLNTYRIGMNHKVELIENSQELIHYFLEDVSVSLPIAAKAWVFTGDVDSLRLLPSDTASELIGVFDAHVDSCFKISELLSFAPLDGYLGFLEPETVSEEVTSPQPNNSLASYMTEYTLPQVVALILHIDLADITTNSSNSYIHENGRYDESTYSKFNNLVQSYSIAALNNKLDGTDVFTRTTQSFLGSPDTQIDLEKTTISRRKLASYLDSIGYQLDNLIAKQDPVHTQCSQYADYQQDESEQFLSLQQQVVELQARLDEKDKAFKAQSEKLNAAVEKVKQAGRSASQLSEHEEMSYQLITSILIQMMTNERGIHNKKPFPSEAEIIREIEAIDLYGYKKGTLAKRFQGAREKLENELRKKTPPRTLDIFQQESTLKKLG